MTFYASAYTKCHCAIATREREEAPELCPEHGTHMILWPEQFDGEPVIWGRLHEDECLACPHPLEEPA